MIGSAIALRHDFNLIAKTARTPTTAEDAGSRVGILPERDQLVIGLDLE